MDRELETGGEIREADADARRNATQNTVADAAKQRAPAGHPGWRQRTAPLAPWTIQGLWLAAGVAAIVYVKSSSWGPFEVIAPVITVLFGACAWLAWLLAWALLARESFALRVTYFGVGLASITFVICWILDLLPSAIEIAVDFARVGVGIATLLAIVYLRGGRIGLPTPDPTSARPPVVRRWQFTLGEVLVLMVGAAIFLALLVARQNQGAEWIVTECAIIACGTVLLVVGLSWQRFVIAANDSVLICAAVILAAIAALQPEFFGNPGEWHHAAIVCAPAILGLLVSIGLARWWGYRLRPSSTPPGGGG